MVVLYILIIAIMCLVELCCIYYFSSDCSSVKLEVGFIGDVPTAIIHRNCFFLPLTAKKIQYKNLKKASFVEKERRNKYSKYMEYDVILNFPNPDDIFVLFRNQSSKKFVLQTCNKINESIATFKSCSVGKYSMKRNIVNILIALLMSIFIFAVLMLLFYQPEMYKIHRIESLQYVFLCLISILVICLKNPKIIMY